MGMKRILNGMAGALLDWARLLLVMILLVQVAAVAAAEPGRARQADLSAAIQGRDTFDWAEAEEIHPGMCYRQWVWRLPRPIRMHAVRVDLSTPGLFFEVTSRAVDAEWGSNMPDCAEYQVRTRRETTRSFMTRMHEAASRGELPGELLLAVNASPWKPWQKPFTHRYADRMGLVMADGVEVCPPDGRPAMIIRNDGRVEFQKVDAGENLTGIRHAVGAFSFILEGGKITPKYAAGKSLAPRTGFGLSEDGRYWYILVVDGRQKNFSMGCTHRELAEFLRYLGARDGLNMDGGGSTTLLSWEPTLEGRKFDGIYKFNHQPGNAERTNGCHIGVGIARQDAQTP